MRRGREGHNHLLDPVIRDDALEVPARAEHRQPRVIVVGGRHRVAVEESDRLQAQLGLRLEALRHQAADLSRADDERRAKGLAVLHRLRPRPVEGDTPCGHVGGREGPGPEGLRREVGRVGQQLAQGEHRHGSEQSRGHDAAELVQDVGAETRPVQPARRAGGDDQDREEEKPAGGRGVDAGGVRTEGRRDRRSRQHRSVDPEPGERPGDLGPHPESATAKRNPVQRLGR